MRIGCREEGLGARMAEQGLAGVGPAAGRHGEAGEREREMGKLTRV